MSNSSTPEATLGTDNLVIICSDSEAGVLTRAIYRDETLWSDVTFETRDELADYITRKFAPKFPLKFVWEDPRLTAN